MQDWGWPSATRPVLALHGGPGTLSVDSHKEYFDPSRQRELFCGQRGVGRSEPYGSPEDNTTPHLVEDLPRRSRLALGRRPM